MKRLLWVSALLSLPAMAVVTLLPGQSEDLGWQAMRANMPIGSPHATEAACMAAVMADAQAQKASADYRCVHTKSARIEWNAEAPTPTPAPAPAPATVSNAQVVGVPWNPELLPAPNSAAVRTGDRVRASSIATPVSSDIAVARVSCDWSHFAPDDPLVFPDQPGRSHLHMFWGNTTVNAATKNFRSDRSTCHGGAANSTGYWIAALIDTRDGRPLVPEGIFNYYKGGYNGVRPADFRAWPAGLRMLAGDAMNARELPNWARHFRWSCAGVSGQHGRIPEGCRAGGELIFEIMFPQCWNGVNLDSPDHKSHMAYASGRGCPSSHPHAMPEITYVVAFRIPETGSSTLRLASDIPGAPAGTAAHADWWDGWDPARVQHLIANCHNQKRDCGTNLLGAGLTLY